MRTAHWLLLGFLCPMLLHAQTNSAGWDSLKRVAPDQSIRVRAMARRGSTCRLVQADDSTLTCVSRRRVFLVPVVRTLRFSRTEVRSVRLSHQGLSALVGTAIGAGAGAGIGFGLDATAKSHEDGDLLAVVMGLLGGIVGAGIGQDTDFLAGPVIYQAP